MNRLKEPFNSLSHAFGAVASLAGLIILELTARSWSAALVYCIYGGSLIFLYSASTCYHALPLSRRLRKIFLKLDRTAIGVLIAGTATPIAVLKLQLPLSAIFLAALWGTVAFLLFSHIFLESYPKWFYVGIFLTMGWLSLLLIGPLVRTLSAGGVLWLLIGGLFYTVGAMIYAFDWPRFVPESFEAHELWHVLTLLGSGAHYVLILGYVA